MAMTNQENNWPIAFGISFLLILLGCLVVVLIYAIFQAELQFFAIFVIIAFFVLTIILKKMLDAEDNDIL